MNDHRTARLLRRHLVHGLLALVAVAALAAAATAGGSLLTREEAADGTGMTVSGEATATAAPDRAEIVLGLEAQADSAVEAQRRNAATMERILAVLTESGVERKDLRTTGYSLEPVKRWDEKSGREVLVGYRAFNLVRVTTHTLDQTGKLVDAAVSAGANNVQGISFALEDESVLRQEALGRAVADARAKAERMARAAGVRLGKVRAMTDTTVETSPVWPVSDLAKASLRAGSESVVPLEPGQMRITTRVTVTFAIR